LVHFPVQHSDSLGEIRDGNVNFFKDFPGFEFYAAQAGIAFLPRALQQFAIDYD
jgi:hypothetical protein